MCKIRGRIKFWVSVMDLLLGLGLGLGIVLVVRDWG